MYILGLSAFYHDSAAALVCDGSIIAAAQEERFTRVKHDSSFPGLAIEHCLKAANISTAELDAVVFYEKPLLKAERLIETYLATAPKGLRSFVVGMPTWLAEKSRVSSTIRKKIGRDFRGSLLFTGHHQSHAASAFFPSPFEEAAILTVDGVGEWSTTTIGVGENNKIHMLREIRFPHSLGMLYSAFTYYTGFKVNSGEYKVMGLAPYGEPRFVQTIYEHLVQVGDDGSIWLNQEYFDYCTGLTMTNERFHDLFGGPPRRPEGPLTQKEMDLAASVQVVTEEVMLRLARFAYQETGKTRLCMAGGVALNCVANGRLLREGPFEAIWVQPAAGDAGGALGAALQVWYDMLDNVRRPERNDAMRGSLLGPEFSDSEIAAFLETVESESEWLPDKDLADRVARLIDAGKVIGWFHGRMEFGPRALGARSIIGDARSERMQSLMNMKIKFRESFRPFAPCVLREHLSDYFDMDVDSPYMLFVAPVATKKRLPKPQGIDSLWGIEKLNLCRSVIPAVTHVDNSARVQTVDFERHGLFHTMMQSFYELTGCPVIINTSFNVRGEPIVCTPQDAYRCFTNTHIDVLVLGNYLVTKKNDSSELKNSDAYLSQFQLD